MDKEKGHSERILEQTPFIKTFVNERNIRYFRNENYRILRCVASFVQEELKQAETHRNESCRTHL